MFDKPKPTVGCSANGRRRRKRRTVSTKVNLKILTTIPFGRPGAPCIYSKMDKRATDKLVKSPRENGEG